MALTKVDATNIIDGILPAANGGTGVTTSTGSGNNVLSTSPTLVTPALGTPSSVNLANGTALPLTTGVTGTLPIANGGTGSTTAAIVAGTGISVSGTFPNQTVTNSSPAVTAGEAKAWVKFVGSTGAISASYNVSSVTRNSTGHYTINFTSSLADGNYAVGGMVFNQTSGNGARSLVSEGTPSSSSFQVFNMLFNGSQEDANASVIVMR